MGGNNSRQQAQQQQQQPQSNLSHLTSDPHYQQMLRQLYANNSSNIINDFPQFRGNLNYNPHRNRANVEVKKATPIQNDLYVHKKSLQFIKKGESFCLTFLFDNIAEVTLSIYYAAQEYTNTINITTSVETSKQQKDNTFIFQPGTNQQFPLDNMPLEFTSYHEGQLTQFDPHRGYYPIIIKMSPTADKQIKAMYLYASCVFNKEKKLMIETKRIKIEKNNRAFIANDVYGASDQNINEEKECAICLTEKVDTMIIPCKHMCLCQTCCADLRFRSQKCPICRKTIERFILVDRSAIKRVTPNQTQDIALNKDLISTSEQ